MLPVRNDSVNGANCAKFTMAEKKRLRRSMLPATGKPESVERFDEVFWFLKRRTPVFPVPV
jgi:hypothetical protein